MDNVELFEACQKGDLAAIRTSLCAGCDPNSRLHGQTPLMYACEQGHAEAASLLISNGAKVGAVDSYNRTALHSATKNGHVECAAVLMKAGARNDIQCSLGGESPADIVHMRGTIEMVRTVLYHNEQPQSTPTETRQSAPPSKLPAEEATEVKNELTADVEAKEAPPPLAVSLPRKAPPAEEDELRKSKPAAVHES